MTSSILAVLFAASLSAGNAEFDASAARGAAVVATRQIVGDLVAQGPDAGELKRVQLADPKKYADRATAEQLCRETFKASFETAYRTRVEAVRKRLALEGAIPSLSAADLAAATTTCYAAAFTRERAEAVAEQAKTLALAVRPDEADFEKKDEKTLRNEMTAKVVREQKTAVFSENVAYVTEKIVDPVIADGRREMKRQREYLMRTKCDAYAPSAMAKEIAANLAANVAQRAAKEKDPVRAWGVFPGIAKDGIAAAVQRRTVGLVTKEVDDVALSVDVETVLKVIRADPAAHQRASDSEKVFRVSYAADLVNGAIERATAAAPEKERDEFAAFARAHTTEAELVRAIETRLKREVLPKWRAARAEAAKSEAERLWPALADRTWYPDADFADALVARSDYAAALKNWRKSPELSALADATKGNVVLEESAMRADQGVAAAFDLARSAINAQNALVDAAQPGVLTKVRELKDGFFTRTPDLKKIIALLTEKVEADWGEKRVATLWAEDERPANAAEQHAALYPSVRRRIELVARQILEDMQKPEPEEKPEEKPPEPEEPPEETPPEETPPEEPPPEVMLYSIVVSREGNDVTVRLDQNKKTLVERKAPAQMKAYQDAVKAVTDQLGRDILKLK